MSDQKDIDQEFNKILEIFNKTAGNNLTLTLPQMVRLYDMSPEADGLRFDVLDIIGWILRIKGYNAFAAIWDKATNLFEVPVRIHNVIPENIKLEIKPTKDGYNSGGKFKFAVKVRGSVTAQKLIIDFPSHPKLTGLGIKHPPPWEYEDLQAIVDVDVSGYIRKENHLEIGFTQVSFVELRMIFKEYRTHLADQAHTLSLLESEIEKRQLTKPKPSASDQNQIQKEMEMEAATVLEELENANALLSLTEKDQKTLNRMLKEVIEKIRVVYTPEAFLEVAIQVLGIILKEEYRELFIRFFLNEFLKKDKLPHKIELFKI